MQTALYLDAEILKKVDFQVDYWIKINTYIKQHLERSNLST